MSRPWLALALTLSLLAPVDSLDRAVQRAVQAGRRPALERPARMINGLGAHVVVLSSLLAIAVLDGAAGPATVRRVLVALIPTNLSVELGKLTFDRTRPDGSHKRANSSFPSSHAANAFTIAWVLARRWRRAAPGLLLLAAAVAFARMYLNRHFLSDVVTGAAIGWVSAHLVLKWYSTRERAGPGASAPPSR
jgi:undecaprenyl-diphosphatase